MSYKDKTFCTYFKQCKIGDKCDRALTFKVKIDAKRVEANIEMFTDYPDCYIGYKKVDK